MAHPDGTEHTDQTGRVRCLLATEWRREDRAVRLRRSGRRLARLREAGRPARSVPIHCRPSRGVGRHFGERLRQARVPCVPELVRRAEPAGCGCAASSGGGVPGVLSLGDALVAVRERASGRRTRKSKKPPRCRSYAGVPVAPTGVDPVTFRFSVGFGGAAGTRWSPFAA